MRLNALCNTFLKALALAITALLGGCYSTESPVFERGEKVVWVGTATCDGDLLFGLSAVPNLTKYLVEEVRENGGSYKYLVSNKGASTSVRLTKVKESFYVMQLNEVGKNELSYLYLRIDSLTQYRVFKVKAGTANIKERVERKFGITFVDATKLNSPLDGTISGRISDLKRFLTDYEAHQYDIRLICRRDPPLIHSTSSTSGRRVALVVGIEDYKQWSPLNNPVRDAKEMATLLREHGFQVTEKLNADFLSFHDAVKDFERAAQGADLALFYYAGHGMEVGGKNILAPSDMPDACEDRTTKRAIELDALFRAIKPARKKIVIIDACRDNPFPRCPTRSTRSGAGFRAFVRVKGSGLLVANATLPGALAYDGVAGQGSPFSRALLARFKRHPKMEFRDLLALVAEDVDKATHGQQTPEITLRGAPPRTCLAGTQCGHGGTGP